MADGKEWDPTLINKMILEERGSFIVRGLGPLSGPELDEVLNEPDPIDDAIIMTAFESGTRAMLLYGIAYQHMQR